MGWNVRWATFFYFFFFFKIFVFKMIRNWLLTFLSMNASTWLDRKLTFFWRLKDSWGILLSSEIVTSAEREVFATLRNASKLIFFSKIRHAKFVGFRFYSGIWRSESRISSRYLEITSISVIYSLTYSRQKELSFWLARGLSRLTCATPSDQRRL